MAGARCTLGSGPRAADRFRRVLLVEALEDRCLLSAGGIGGLDPQAPWRNAELPLDVNHDGVVQPIDVAQVVNQLLKGGIRPLRAPDPANPPQYYCDTTVTPTATT
jgi:hypothetical protein